MAADGSPLYGTADIAAVLGVSAQEAEDLVTAGEQVAARALVVLLGGEASTTEPEASYLVSVVEADGSRWVTEAELSRCEQARTAGPNAEVIAASGGPDDQLSVSEAARLSGVTTRYLRGLCRRYHDNRAEIEEAMEEGKPPRRACVVSYRGTKGQWIIKRADLVAFVHRRTVPAVRVGFDLTLTTEKSLGVLACWVRTRPAQWCSGRLRPATPPASPTSSTTLRPGARASRCASGASRWRRSAT